MALGIVDRALPEINYSGGNKKLYTICSMNVDESDDKQPVETMNPDRAPIGFTRGVKKTTLDLDTVILQGAPEVNWRRLKETGEYFLLTWTEEGGNRLSAVDAIVDSVSTPYSASGEIHQGVKLKCRYIREEP